MRDDRPNIIVEKTFCFSLDIIHFCDLLDDEKKYNLSKQLFRSGTSIGANVREAQNAQSKADFIHKMKIAAKEADETWYWLLLCEQAKRYPKNRSLLDQIEVISKVLSKIISSTKQKTENSQS
jgi:four helix bundle protein